jgi:hypothetical protein
MSRLGAKRSIELSRSVELGNVPTMRSLPGSSRADPLGFWLRSGKTVLPLAGITDTGPARGG